MSHGIFLLSWADWVLNPGPLKKRCPSPLGCIPLGWLRIHEVRGLRFDFAGTKRLSAPGGHLVGPGDILPTGS